MESPSALQARRRRSRSSKIPPGKKIGCERLEDCVNFAAKCYRTGYRSAFPERASPVLHDLEAMQKALGVENRKLRNGRKRAAAVLARQKL